MKKFTLVLLLTVLVASLVSAQDIKIGGVVAIVGASFAYKDLKAKKATSIFDLGNDYTKGLAENFKATFEKLTGKGSVVAYEGHQPGSTDFKAQLTKILSAKPDVIYTPDYYNDVGLIAKQVRELGFKGPLVGGDGWDSPDLVKIGGTAVGNGFFTNHYSAEDTRPIVQDFVKKYKIKNGKQVYKTTVNP